MRIETLSLEARISEDVGTVRLIIRIDILDRDVLVQQWKATSFAGNPRIVFLNIA